MPDKPVNEVNLSTVLALLTELDRKVREGFDALTHEQKVLPEDQQTLSKRMEDGFAAAAREQQTLSRRVEDGFAAAAHEQQTLSKRVEDGFAAVAREQQALREDQQTLSQRVEDSFATAAREQQTLSQRMEDGFVRIVQEYRALSNRMDEGFATEAQKREALENKFDNFKNWLMKEIPENAHILSKMIERAQNEFAEFKREKSVYDKDVLQRLSRLETARSLN